MSANDPFATLPAVFGRYRVLKLLGKGGMGAVYLADDTNFKSRQVALKIPNQQLIGDAVARFQREADSAALLEHPNICPIYDVGVIDGRHFLAMKFIEGRPLSDLVGPGKFWPDNDAIDVVMKLANALQYAHDKGVIHRDIKPLNVMMRSDGEPILMDFGLAKLAGDPAITASGAVFGSPYYMSLEQARGQQAKIGPHSDVYSLGVLMFEMVTGNRPFTGDSVVDILVKIALGTVPPARTFRQDIHPQLEAVIQKATAKYLEDRYANMQEFTDSLSAVKNARTHMQGPADSRRKKQSATLNKSQQGLAENVVKNKRIKMKSTKNKANDSSYRYPHGRRTALFATGSMILGGIGMLSYCVWPQWSNGNRQRLSIPLARGLSMSFVYCPPGKFRMGSEDNPDGIPSAF
ncbi:MAG: serine/threonine protein kinase [Gemmataceae bacterium]|nr:serine/threonine protein kinase [Gemmataceae bacterium]